jgi:4-hydroxy-3-polyprenylbenzoate decarboxylase
MFITEGILDALDHSSPESLVGGKLGIDATTPQQVQPLKELLSDEQLFQKVQECIEDISALKQYMVDTPNPITVISVNKTRNAREYFEALRGLEAHLRIVVFVDALKNDVTNPYMVIWRVTNNIDALRDVYSAGMMVGVDGTNKTPLDGFTRRWPDDVDCTPEVVERLQHKGVWDLEESLYKKYQL